MGLFERLGREAEKIKREVDSARDEGASFRCVDCGATFYADREECDDCGSEDVVPAE